MAVIVLPQASPPRKMPIAPGDPFKASYGQPDVDEEEIEEILETLTSSQGLETLIGVIDSLISTIEYQEVMIWSLAKLLEEKGLITKDELMKKVEEANKRKTSSFRD
ncbi:MAG: hypothetical protein DRJ62_02315 [Thermoprotei archaeon]|nr:MAG: hypothetical protein DRJ62_02315 [Thermoprotei archaeon]